MALLDLNRRVLVPFVGRSGRPTEHDLPPQLPPITEPWPYAIPPRVLDFVITPDGSLVSSAPGASDWVEDPQILRRLAEEAQARGAGWWRIPPLTVRCVRLEGPAGQSLLLSVIPPRPELAEALGRLTPTQMLVAEYAAGGATVREIADTLDRAPDTVRSHLKAVYRLMWVANRVELAQLLRRTAISHGA